MQQIAAINDPKKLHELISSQFNDDLLLQQAILQHLNYMRFTPQIIQCNLQNSLDEASVITTANDTTVKILVVFKQYKQHYLNQQPMQLC